MNDIPTHPSQTAVFVFGSNKAGVHGAGAALHASKWCGAIHGVGSGPMADSAIGLSSYAIPTKETPSTSLDLNEIKMNIEAFKSYAQSNPSRLFMITRIGCGLAGFNDKEIAPLFFDAPANCLLPGTWAAMKEGASIARLIVGGSRSVRDRSLVFDHLDRLTERLSKKPRFEIVSGMAQGVDSLGIEWATIRGLGSSVVKFPAQWGVFGRQAGYIRNQQMSWYGTHLAAFWDGQSPGTKNMIAVAQKDGLRIKTLKVRS